MQLNTEYKGNSMQWICLVIKMFRSSEQASQDVPMSANQQLTQDGNLVTASFSFAFVNRERQDISSAPRSNLYKN
jgi:hypothetical protein